MTNTTSDLGGLGRLLEVDIESRDENWEKDFFPALASARVSILSPDPQEGPDHWPYLFVSSEGDTDEPMLNVLSWLSTRGIGLALNPHKPTPDFVLTYGMIWNYRERGEFLTAPKDQQAGQGKVGRFEIKPGQPLWTGVPSEAYLPQYARSILKQFFADQGVFTPKVLMVSFDGPEVESRHFELCLSIESLKSPPAHEHANIAEAVSWFLPAHYPVSLVSEKVVPGFQPL